MRRQDGCPSAASHRTEPQQHRETADELRVSQLVLKLTIEAAEERQRSEQQQREQLISELETVRRGHRAQLISAELQLTHASEREDELLHTVTLLQGQLVGHQDTSQCTELHQIVQQLEERLHTAQEEAGTAQEEANARVRECGRVSLRHETKLQMQIATLEAKMQLMHQQAELAVRGQQLVAEHDAAMERRCSEWDAEKAQLEAELKAMKAAAEQVKADQGAAAMDIEEQTAAVVAAEDRAEALAGELAAATVQLEEQKAMLDQFVDTAEEVSGAEHSAAAMLASKQEAWDREKLQLLSQIEAAKQQLETEVLKFQQSAKAPADTEQVMRKQVEALETQEVQRLQSTKGIILRHFMDSSIPTLPCNGMTSTNRDQKSEQPPIQADALQFRKKLVIVDSDRLLATTTVEHLVTELCLQTLTQHDEDVDVQHQLQETLERALQSVEVVQREKAQIISDKLQLEVKIVWMKSRMQAEELAYKMIKKKMQPWILRMRVLKLVRASEGNSFKMCMKKRDAKLVDMVYLLSNYGKQLRVLFDQYCVPLHELFEQKAYTQMDPHGFSLKCFKEYTHAVHQMAKLYGQVETEVNRLKGAASHTIGDPELVLFEQIRLMWLGRGAFLKLTNRQRAVNVAVRKYKEADKEFGAALYRMKCDCRTLGVTAGFDYLSGFLSLQTLCSMQDHLKQLAKMTREQSPDHPHCEQVQICADLLSRMKCWLDSHLKAHTRLVEFQRSVPLAEVSLVSESRKMLHNDDLLKTYPDCCGHGEALKPIHVALLSDCLVLCGIRQNTDANVAALRVEFMRAAGCHKECEKVHSWSPPCDAAVPANSVAKVLQAWWCDFKGLPRTREAIQADLQLCYNMSNSFKLTDHSTLTFLELLELLRPVSQQMGFEQNQKTQYRIDTVLCSQSGIRATLVAAAQFRVTGTHYQMGQNGPDEAQLPVEVSLEASSQTAAEEWVQQINSAPAQHQELLLELQQLEHSFNDALTDSSDTAFSDTAFFPTSQPSQFAHENRKMSASATHHREQEADTTKRLTAVLEGPVLSQQRLQAAQVDQALEALCSGPSSNDVAEMSPDHVNERFEEISSTLGLPSDIVDRLDAETKRKYVKSQLVSKPVDQVKELVQRIAQSRIEELKSYTDELISELHCWTSLMGGNGVPDAVERSAAMACIVETIHTWANQQNRRWATWYLG